MKKAMKSGFTLIELLVVVAIIAIIGAGVAVTFNRLDERAKVAMEMNDIGVLEKTILNWSFLHDNNLPNKLDSLVTTDDLLYSAMTGSSGTGLGMQAGFTFEAETAPDTVISQLAGVGINLVYRHLADVTPANDSTFRKPSSSYAVNKLDTSETAATLVAPNRMGTVNGQTSDSRIRARAIVAANDAAVSALTQPEGYDPADESTHGDYKGTYTLSYKGDSGETVSETFSQLSDWQSAYSDAEAIAEASEVNNLCFLYPEGGTQMGMNLAYEIIINAGLDPDKVADPVNHPSITAAAAANKEYWLVVFGIGRFCSLYEGNGAKIASPVAGKRYASDDKYYNRYLMVVKVPVDAYDSMTNQGGKRPTLAAVLSPIGLSRTRLDSVYDAAVEATSN